MASKVSKCFCALLCWGVRLSLRAETALEAEALEWVPSELPVETGSSWPHYLLLLLFALLATALGVTVWIFKRRRPEAPEEILGSAEQLMKDLKKARQALSLPQSKAFATLLSTGVRRYIEREFPRQSRTQTTEEFLHSFQQVERINWETQSALCDVLRFSDQVKFADRELPVPERRALYLKACTLALTLRRLYRQEQREKLGASGSPGAGNSAVSVAHG
ncbi:MAG: hypothetical protein LBF21_02455 [Puniceicoccales bacterium]|nr:hypothetical protein [Puniceicoccales bacterium]